MYVSRSVSVCVSVSVSVCLCVCRVGDIDDRVRDMSSISMTNHIRCTAPIREQVCVSLEFVIGVGVCDIL